MTNLDSVLKKERHHFVNKVPRSQGYGLSSSHMQIWELDHKEGWKPKNLCYWIMVLKKTPESALDCKEIKPVHAKRNQSWIFIGRTDAEAEIPILWPPDAKSWLIWKDPDAGKDWGWEEEMTEDEVVGWHHQINGHELGHAPRDGEWQGGGLVWCSPLGCKESDTAQWLNINNYISLKCGS